MRSVLIGIIAALFFSATFILNRSMSLEGGSFAWSASLRFLFMIPLLLAVVAVKGSTRKLFADLRRRFAVWFIWGTVGFGIFYAGICFAGENGPGWLIASTFQLTIIFGPLMAPVFGEKIPWSRVAWSALIVCGVMIIQFDQIQAVSIKAAALTVIPLLLAAIAYPLGNRKMMSHIQGELDPFSRILGMCIGSLPCWILLSVYGYAESGLPTSSQLVQSLLVAVCSGLIATTLFFFATDLAGNNQNVLAMVESTQATEVIFTLIGEVVLLHSPLPSLVSSVGILVVCLGIVMQSRGSNKKLQRTAALD
ncbi:multidrug resistance efflux transporter family protein [Brevibacillus sp. B_LB10_24]|uniref:DMT family transporter n=1 Tax=Brevibacillus sp. B_LB10_24 TaxID=3380645 RepID=UPI0038B7134E